MIRLIYHRSRVGNSLACSKPSLSKASGAQAKGLSGLLPLPVKCALGNCVASSPGNEPDQQRRFPATADHGRRNATGQGAEAGYREAKAAGVKIQKIWVTDDPCEDCNSNSDVEIDVPLFW
jgi:hypothetical protein